MPVFAVFQVGVLTVPEAGVSGHAHVGQVVDVVAAASVRGY